VNKEKRKYFILGLLSGIILAGAIFVIFLVQSVNGIESRQRLTLRTLFRLQQKPDPSLATDSTQILPTDSIANTSTPGKKIIKRDTVYVEQQILALPQEIIQAIELEDSLEQNSELVSDNVVIKQDKLLAFKTIKINYLVEPNKTLEQQTSDSLMRKVSGIRDPSKETNQTMRVELWESPLNYKGFQMSKNKLVLYGFRSIEDIVIYKRNDDVFMDLGTSLYQLNYTDTFKPYRLAAATTRINRVE
jgi:hypothetical protein